MFSICKSCPSRVDNFHNDWKVLNFANHSTWASASSLLATAISWSQDGWSVFMAPCFSSSSNHRHYSPIFCLPVFSYPSVSISKPSQKPPKKDALNIRWCEPNCCELSTLLPWANHDTNYGVISGITCLNLWGVSQRTSKCYTKKTKPFWISGLLCWCWNKTHVSKLFFFSNPQVSFKWIFLNVYLFRKVF